MAYGLAEGFGKTVVRLGGKKKNRAVVIATFGNHFSMNDAIERFRNEGLQFETEKGHIVKLYLDKNTKESAAQVRSIIREHLCYLEPPPDTPTTYRSPLLPRPSTPSRYADS